MWIRANIIFLLIPTKLHPESNLALLTMPILKSDNRLYSDHILPQRIIHLCLHSLPVRLYHQQVVCLRWYFGRRSTHLLPEFFKFVTPCHPREKCAVRFLQTLCLVFRLFFEIGKAVWKCLNFICAWLIVVLPRGHEAVGGFEFITDVGVRVHFREK